MFCWSHASISFPKCSDCSTAQAAAGIISLKRQKTSMNLLLWKYQTQPSLLLAAMFLHQNTLANETGGLHIAPNRKNNLANIYCKVENTIIFLCEGVYKDMKKVTGLESCANSVPVKLSLSFCSYFSKKKSICSILGFEVNVIAVIHSALPDEISPPNKSCWYKETEPCELGLNLNKNFKGTTLCDQS